MPRKKRNIIGRVTAQAKLMRLIRSADDADAVNTEDARSVVLKETEPSASVDEIQSLSVCDHVPKSRERQSDARNPSENLDIDFNTEVVRSVVLNECEPSTSVVSRRKRSSIGRVTAQAKLMRLIRSSDAAETSDNDVNTEVVRSVVLKESEPSTSVDERQSLSVRERVANSRARQSDAEREKRLANDRERHAAYRLSESQTNREARLSADRLFHRTSREGESLEAREARLEADRLQHSTSREAEPYEAIEVRMTADRLQHRASREVETFEARAVRLEADRLQHSTSREAEPYEAREVRMTADRLQHRASREVETFEAREVRLEADRLQHSTSREAETFEAREVRMTADRLQHRTSREVETFEAREVRLEADRLQHSTSREAETFEAREARLMADRTQHNCFRIQASIQQIEARRVTDQDRYITRVNEVNRNSEVQMERLNSYRASQSQRERDNRLAADAERHHVARHVETAVERQGRLLVERGRHAQRHMLQWRNKHNSGFQYDPLVNYSEAASLGAPNNVCPHCRALTWAKEPSGICCASGKVSLPAIEDPPEPLRTWLTEDTPESRNFLNNIRAYNSAFQMTSFGGNEIHEGGYMPTFKVQGQVYHLIGSLLPNPDRPASFLQIYFVGDSQAQLQRRLSLFENLNENMVDALQTMLHEHNIYIQSFKTTIETVPPDSPNFRIIIRADRRPAGAHPGRYNEPTSSEVALLMVGEPSDRRDIVLNSRDEGLKRIYETHRSYDALQYPIIFCRGEDGYHFNIKHVNPVNGQETNKTTSSREFYAYRIMIRENYHNHIHKFRQLFNQFLVDMYAKVEGERLLYLRTHQKELRAENYIHLQDALRREDSVEQLGQKVILPSSFTGGPRYMHSRTQDAFCYVRKFGRPDLFITITTNPKWPEIVTVIGARQSSEDRHDITSRVFQLKLNCLMALLTKGKVFGSVKCFMYSVEWQKRGLPHAHILLWLEEPIRPERVDQVISAELPDPQVDPELSEIVKSHMLHGPCGAFSVRCRQLPCMKDGRCSKRYPRQFVRETKTGDDGYPTYRRRSPEDGGQQVFIRAGGENVPIDNRWVVAYSPVLSRTFKTHVNVEYCSSVKSIKYICKYVNKGTDQATFAVSDETDEIHRYQSGRYICSSEAVWRILAFPIHDRFPAVTHLEVHLPDEQRVYFQPDNVQAQMERSTTLLAFFDLCQTDEFSRTLIYSDVPSFFTYNRQRGWARRLRGTPVEGFPNVKRNPCIGRVYTVHPSSSERYCLRLLLHSVRGPTSFDYLKTVQGVLHPTFQAACRALGLMEDDSCWVETIREAVVSDSPCKLRDLFCVLVVFCNLSNALDLWMRFRDSLSEDYLRAARLEDVNTTYETSPNLYKMCLTEIQGIISRIGGMSLESYNLPVPERVRHPINIEYIRETSYNSPELLDFVARNITSLTREQRGVYENVLSSIHTPSNQNVFFLDAPGGTGKTYLINLILAQVRGEHKIALAVASSGIAATLLPGGRTAHSMFKIPINVEHTEFPVCSISRNNPMAQVIRDCSLIVWDECTMANKLSIEALDRTLKDIRNNNQTMGGVTVLFSGDFRQTLPVVVRGTRADEINACLKRSVLWPTINRLSLTVNMRVYCNGADHEVGEFSEVLMRIGDGALKETDGLISLPISLGKLVNSQNDLIQSVFPRIHDLPNVPGTWLCDRAILTPTNDQATEINRKVMALYQSEERTYRSVNTVINQDDAVHYPAEFLESVTAPGLPAHELTLKVGCPIMLLRNLNAPKLCNGTRLRVRRLHQYVIEAEILTGSGVGESIFIPRIPLIPSNYPFEFKRLQFPVSVCYAMTINKSQGQTLSTAGIELSGKGCFSHGQLYVACSRVGKASRLFIHAPGGKTTNVVYREALQ